MPPLTIPQYFASVAGPSTSGGAPIDINAGARQWQGAKALAAGVEDLGEVAFKLEDETQKLRAVQAVNQFEAGMLATIAEAKQRQAGDAIGVTNEYGPKLAKARDEVLKGYSGYTINKEALGKALDAHILSGLKELSHHESHQRDVWKHEQAQATLDLLKVRAAKGDDAEVLRKSMDAAIETIYGRGGAAAPEFLQNRKDYFRSHLEASIQTYESHHRIDALVLDMKQRFGADPEQFKAAREYAFDLKNEAYRKLSAAEREHAVNILYSDIERDKAIRAAQRHENGRELLAEYDQLQQGNLSTKDWHRRVQQGVKDGVLDTSMMTMAMTLEHAERVAAKQAEKENPWLKDNVETVGRLKLDALTNPGGVDLNKVQGLVGKGVSFASYAEIEKLVRGDGKSIWSSVAGEQVKQTLKKAYEGGTFGRAYMGANKREMELRNFSAAVQEMQEYLRQNPSPKPKELAEKTASVIAPHDRMMIQRIIEEMLGR